VCLISPFGSYHSSSTQHAIDTPRRASNRIQHFMFMERKLGGFVLCGMVLGWCPSTCRSFRLEFAFFMAFNVSYELQSIVLSVYMHVIVVPLSEHFFVFNRHSEYPLICFFLLQL